jgi:lysyl-tRNA synthetase
VQVGVQGLEFIWCLVFGVWSFYSPGSFMEQPPAPVPSENSLIKERRDKLARLREKGIDPFKNKFTPDRSCDEARSKFDKGELSEGTRVSVAGRITAHRDMGKSIFIDVRDQSGRVQIYAQKQALGDDQFDVFKHLDLGDFIGVTGTMFRTKTNEPSIKLETFTILAKALRPPPAKWHGLEDTEIRYRQRYLDLMGNPEVKDVFLKRSAIVHEIRSFFHSRGYVEVETPAMQAIPGGAAAQPFKTFHNALGCDFYLRIALELYHKRLLVGGIDKLFEIGKNFRNEGLSRRHNPEFTMLEAYCAFGDYESMMETVESLIRTVAWEVLGTNAIPTARAFVSSAGSINSLRRRSEEWNLSTQMMLGKTSSASAFQNAITRILKGATTLTTANFRTVLQEYLDAMTELRFVITDAQRNSVEIDHNRVANVLVELDPIETPIREAFNDVIALGNRWERIQYKALIRRVAGADWFDISPAERRQRAHDLGAEIGKEYEDFEVTGAVFEKLIEPTLIQPTFVTHLPKELVPLAKLSPDDPTTVEVFECCINGQEIAPGYTEQNDPIAQRNTLEHQAGGEQQKLDEDFLVALEHGMPPAGGIGLGIDRLCMMLLGQESIRDVILFPQLKPK